MSVLATLTPREEKVLRLRFGIEDGRTRTLEEVGKEFNVTRERIRQIEAKALRKLRHPSRSKKLPRLFELRLLLRRKNHVPTRAKKRKMRSAQKRQSSSCTRSAGAFSP